MFHSYPPFAAPCNASVHPLATESANFLGIWTRVLFSIGPMKDSRFPGMVMSRTWTLVPVISTFLESSSMFRLAAASCARADQACIVMLWVADQDNQRLGGRVGYRNPVDDHPAMGVQTPPIAVGWKAADLQDGGDAGQTQEMEQR